MLTPRYKKMSDLLSDFGQMMEGMDAVQPTVEAKRKWVAGRKPDGKPIYGTEDAEEPAPSDDVEEQDEIDESTSPMYQYKVMAGLVEREMVPRDPGLWGTTRFNDAYLQEGGGTRRKKEGRAEKRYDSGENSLPFPKDWGGAKYKDAVGAHKASVKRGSAATYYEPHPKRWLRSGESNRYWPNDPKPSTKNPSKDELANKTKPGDLEKDQRKGAVREYGRLVKDIKQGKAPREFRRPGVARGLALSVAGYGKTTGPGGRLPKSESYAGMWEAMTGKAVSGDELSAPKWYVKKYARRAVRGRDDLDKKGKAAAATTLSFGDRPKLPKDAKKESAEVQEGRSKAQQAAGQKAMFKRALQQRKADDKEYERFSGNRVKPISVRAAHGDTTYMRGPKVKKLDKKAIGKRLQRKTAEYTGPYDQLAGSPQDRMWRVKRELSQMAKKR